MKKTIITLALIAATLVGGGVAWNRWGWMTSFDMPFEPKEVQKKRIAYQDLKREHIVLEVIEASYESYGSGNWDVFFLVRGVNILGGEGIFTYKGSYNDKNEKHDPYYREPFFK